MARRRRRPGFTATPEEEANFRAAGWYDVPCSLCGAKIWCNPAGVMLNGVSSFQFADEDNPVSGKRYECSACNEAKHAKGTW